MSRIGWSLSLPDQCDEGARKRDVKKCRRTTTIL